MRRIGPKRKGMLILLLVSLSFLLITAGIPADESTEVEITGNKIPDEKMHEDEVLPSIEYREGFEGDLDGPDEDKKEFTIFRISISTPESSGDAWFFSMNG